MFERLIQIFEEASTINERLIGERIWNFSSMSLSILEKAVFVEEISREDFRRIYSECLPSLRKNIKSLIDTFDSANLLFQCSDNLNPTDCKFMLATQTSELIIGTMANIRWTAPITGDRRVDKGEENGKKLKVKEVMFETLKGSDMIMVPSIKYFSMVSTIYNLSSSWGALLSVYRHYLEDLRELKAGSLPSRFWPEIITNSENCLKTIDVLNHQALKSNRQYVLEIFKSLKDSFELQKKGYEKMIIQFFEEPFDGDYARLENKRVFVRTFMKVPVLFRLLVTRLFFEKDHSSFEIFLRLSYNQLIDLKLEFEKWVKNYSIRFESDGWRIFEDTKISIQFCMMESLEKIEGILLFGVDEPKMDKSTDPDDGENHVCDWKGYGYLKAKYYERFNELQVYEKNEEKIWIRNWLAQISLVIQKVISNFT